MVCSPSLQGSTCGDADGTGGSPAAFFCQSPYKARNNVDDVIIQGLDPDDQQDACCERVSAESCSCISLAAVHDAR
jgi:hypothetical protein